jgi:hypothetical protein
MDQNVQYLEMLKNQPTSLGLIQSDGTMNVTLINGIVKSAAHYKLKSQAEYEERQKNGTYESTKLALKIKYTQVVDSNEITAGGAHTAVNNDTLSVMKALLTVKNQQQKAGKVKTGGLKQGGVTPDIAGAAIITKKRPAGERFCTHCKQQGYEQDTCCELHPCTICGGKHGK